MIIPIFKLTCNTFTQLEKIEEEFKEVKEAVEELQGEERIKEECMDLIQATINFIALKYGTLGLEEAINTHYKKMKKRKYNINKNLVLEYEKQQIDIE